MTKVLNLAKCENERQYSEETYRLVFNEAVSKFTKTKVLKVLQSAIKFTDTAILLNTSTHRDLLNHKEEIVLLFVHTPSGKNET